MAYADAKTEVINRLMTDAETWALEPVGERDRRVALPQLIAVSLRPARSRAQLTQALKGRFEYEIWLRDRDSNPEPCG